MEKNRKSVCIWACRILVHVGIACIVSGILLIGYFLYKGNFAPGDVIGVSFEKSAAFYQDFETMTDWASENIWIKNNLAPDGTIDENREIPFAFYTEDGQTLELHYRLGDINRWYGANGVTRFQGTYEEYVQAVTGETQNPSSLQPEKESTDAEASYDWLEEIYAPGEYDNLLEAAQAFDLSPEETSRLNTCVAEFVNNTGLEVKTFYQRKEQLDPANTSFRYFARSADGSIYTNMEGVSNMEAAEKEILGNQKMLYYSWNTANGEEAYNFPGEVFSSEVQGEVWRKNWISRADQGVDWMVITAVDTDYPAEDLFTQTKEELDQLNPLFFGGLTLLVAGGLVYLFCFLYLSITAGWQADREACRLYAIDRVNTEVSVVLFGMLALGLLWIDYLGIVAAGGLLYDDRAQTLMAIGIVAGAAVLSNLGLMAGWLSLVRRIKAGLLWKNSLCRKLLHFAKSCWQGRTVTLRTGLCYVGFLVVHFWVYKVIDSFWLLMLLDGGVGAFLLWRALQEQQIDEGIDRIARGDIEAKIPTEKLKGDYRKKAEAINHMGEGLSAALEKSLKNERLKTDLITNVSHDIKTPLTSIINYVDLLKRENIQDEKIRGYIEILDKKSQRLKNLTEDLVEASKISSGNISLELVPIDFGQLVMQTNGEFEEKFAARGLRLVTRIPEEPVYVMADGRRLWRVVENLYNNTSKYALQDSRVYADLQADEIQVTFSLKNISEQPLNISADELTERFVRGDVSRTTEGSGLGLSIAQNLTTLQKGKFEIYLDGDLFRVTLTFPRVKAEKPDQTTSAAEDDAPVAEDTP